MPGWVTHICIADALLRGGLKLDARGFCVGSIAPDCNVENADWTEFTPSREVTHWMSVRDDKSTADFEGFFNRYISGRRPRGAEELAFLAGYYAHLITDVEFVRMLHDGARVAAVFERLERSECYRARIAGMPRDYDTLRSLGGQFRRRDILLLEDEYLRAHPESLYFTLLRHVTEFPDYIDYLPRGAITRKIGVMVRAPGDAPAEGLMFLDREEYEGYIRRTCDIVRERIEYVYM